MESLFKARRSTREGECPHKEESVDVKCPEGVSSPGFPCLGEDNFTDQRGIELSLERIELILNVCHVTKLVKFIDFDATQKRNTF